MKKFVDANHLPSIPKSYTFPGTNFRVVWGNNITWNMFYADVVRVATANGIPVPSMEVVEDDVCDRFPKGWCTGEPNYRPPALQQSAPCRSCGHR
jgi:hypothetical protein